MRMEATREALLRWVPATPDETIVHDKAMHEIAKTELILAQVEKLIVIEGLLDEIKEARKR